MTYKEISSQKECESLLNQLLEEIFDLKRIIGESIPQRTQTGISLDDSLWTVEDVAGYLQKSKGTIQSHYQNRYDFPRARKIGSKRYWKPKEVIAYAQKVPNL